MFESKTGQQKSIHRICHVAYTLNNTQPVISTIIGDQPLFYMDYDCEYEDEDYGISLDFTGEFEQELSTLRNELESLERFSSDFVQTTEDRIGGFLENADDLTSPVVDLTHNKNAVDILSESRLGAAYLDYIAEHNIKITYSEQVLDAEYNVSQGVIILNPKMDVDTQILSLVKTVRRAYLDCHDAYINPLLFTPDAAVFVHRLYEADAAVSMVRVAWELQLAGHRSTWEIVENSSMADLAHTFAREAFFDFRTLNNGRACAAVFETWFLSERCRAADKVIIQDMLADYQGYMFDLDHAEDKRQISPAFVARFGDMPCGKNYLSGHVETIMADPVFTDVRDRANANFLWFIKFERSFREAEQDLQSGSVSSSGGDRYADFPSDTDQDEFYEPRRGHSSADIIALSDYTGDQQPDSGHIKQDRSANIIYLRRWSAD